MGSEAEHFLSWRLVNLFFLFIKPENKNKKSLGNQCEASLIICRGCRFLTVSHQLFSSLKKSNKAETLKSQRMYKFFFFYCTFCAQ